MAAGEPPAPRPPSQDGAARRRGSRRGDSGPVPVSTLAKPAEEGVPLETDEEIATAVALFRANGTLAPLAVGQQIVRNFTDDDTGEAADYIGYVASVSGAKVSKARIVYSDGDEHDGMQRSTLTSLRMDFIRRCAADPKFADDGELLQRVAQRPHAGSDRADSVEEVHDEGKEDDSDEENRELTRLADLAEAEEREAIAHYERCADEHELELMKLQERQQQAPPQRVLQQPQPLPPSFGPVLSPQQWHLQQQQRQAPQAPWEQQQQQVQQQQQRQQQQQQPPQVPMQTQQQLQQQQQLLQQQQQQQQRHACPFLRPDRCPYTW